MSPNPRQTKKLKIGQEIRESTHSRKLLAR